MDGQSVKNGFGFAVFLTHFDRLRAIRALGVSLEKEYAMKLKFFLPMMIPSATHQEKKIMVVNGKPVVYEPQNVKDARQKFMAALAPYAPNAPFAGPVRLSTTWIYLATTAHPVKSWKTTKPDTDNLVKLLKDVMTDLGFWTDDALVACEEIQKFYLDKPGLYIEIEELTNG